MHPNLLRAAAFVAATAALRKKQASDDRSPKPTNTEVGVAVPAAPRTPPTPNPLHIPRAGWKPPLRNQTNAVGEQFVAPDARYIGHYKPEAAYPNYGDKLEAEVSKAKAYQEQFRNSDYFQSSGARYPKIEHGRLHSSIPIFAGGASAYDRVNPLGVSLPHYQRPSTMPGGFPYDLGGYATPSGRIDLPQAELQDGDPRYEAALQSLVGPTAGRNGFTLDDVRGVTKQFSPVAIDHELRHAWTISPNDPDGFWDTDVKNKKSIGGDRTYLPALPHRKMEDGAAEIAPFIDDQMAYPGASHGLAPAEQLGWLSGLQHELFGATGRRLETPEDAHAYLTRMVNLPPEDFESETSGFSSDAARGMKALRELRSPDRKGLYGGGNYRDEDGNRAMMPREQVADKYIEWLSKLAPALVSNEQPGGAHAKQAANTRPEDEEEDRPVSVLPLAGLLTAGGVGAKGLSNLFGNDQHYEGIRQALQSHDQPYQPWETAATRYQRLMSRGAGSSLFGVIPAGDVIANVRKDQTWGDVFQHPRLKSLFADATTGPADLLSIPENYRSRTQGSHLQDLAHYEQFAKGPVAAWWHQLHANGESVPLSQEAWAVDHEADNYRELMADRFKQYFRKETDTSWLEPHEINTKRLPLDKQEGIMKGFYETLPPELQQERQRVETGLWGEKYKGHTENYGGYMRGALGMHDKLQQISRTALGGGAGAGAAHLLHDLVRGEDDQDEERRDWKYWLSMLGGAGAGGAIGNQWPALVNQFR